MRPKHEPPRARHTRAARPQALMIRESASYPDLTTRPGPGDRRVIVEPCFDDEVIAGACITRDGEIVHEAAKAAAEAAATTSS